MGKARTLGYLTGCFLAIASIACPPEAFAQSQEDPHSLPAWRWQHRILAVNCADQNCLQDWLSQIANQQLYLAERKLRVYVKVHQQWYWLTADTSRPIAMQPKADELVQSKEADVVLIGLDGSAKATYAHSDFNWLILADTIDRMPMRRAELNQN